MPSPAFSLNKFKLYAFRKPVSKEITLGPSVVPLRGASPDARTPCFLTAILLLLAALSAFLWATADALWTAVETDGCCAGVERICGDFGNGRDARIGEVSAGSIIGVGDFSENDE